MGKQKAPPKQASNEARAVLRMLRISPQKLNLLAQPIRGLSVEKAIDRTALLAQAHRQGRAEVLNRRSTTPRTTTASTSTAWSSPKPMSARTS